MASFQDVKLSVVVGWKVLPLARMARIVAMDAGSVLPMNILYTIHFKKVTYKGLGISEIIRRLWMGYLSIHYIFIGIHYSSLLVGWKSYLERLLKGDALI